MVNCRGGIAIEVKVSIITPFYNGLPYLKECVNSILAQTLNELELILVDDGSTDGSGALADEIAKRDGRIRIIHQKNAGVSSARNAALAIAQGEFIGFVDADDFIEPGLYDKMVTAAIENNADIVNSGYTVNDSRLNSNEIVKPPFETGKVLGSSDIHRYASNMHSSGCFLFVWRNLFTRRLITENMIRFDEDIAIGEDTLFCMECFLNAEYAFSIDLHAYHYRLHPTGCMRQKYKPSLSISLQKQFESKLRLCNKYLNAYKAEFYYDMAKYTVTALFPAMLSNIYLNNTPHKEFALTSIVKSPMMQKSFADFNLKEIRSRSLDWLMFWFAKNKLYFIAHLICKQVLYKKERI